MTHHLGIRLLEKIQVRDECWHWTGATNAQGYGRVWDHGKFYYPHRIMFELMSGPIPDRMQLDHLCRNPGCVRPSHLEPVTNRENTLRGKVSALRDRPEPTHCKRGHAYAERGTRGAKGELRCRECARIKRFDALRAAGKPQRKSYPVKGASL